MTDFENTARISKDIRALKRVFIKNELYSEFTVVFDTVLSDLLGDIEDKPKRRAKAEGIVVYGNSGSGKTTALEYLIDNHPCIHGKREVKSGTETITKTDICAIKTESPTSLKIVGISILVELGYDPNNEGPDLTYKDAAYIWRLVHKHLRKSEVLFLVIDEAQDFILNQNRLEVAKILSTLKSLLENKTWPVSVILSGMPELDSLVKGDIQLRNRVTTVSCKRLSAEVHGKRVAALISRYAREADLECSADLLTIKFVRRLLHASLGDFGRTVAEIIRAIAEALKDESKNLTSDHFVAGFAKKYDCVSSANPYFAPDYSEINTEGMIDQPEGEMVRGI